MIHYFLLWCHTGDITCDKKTYIIEDAPADYLTAALTNERLQEIIDDVNNNAWIFEKRKCNSLQLKQLEAAVNKRNKLNRLMELKDI